ncbi:MAG: hypothetical protein K2X81_11865 [Candidatus Obscuribacterales bacterium]|nr:hypothetical protein [Candidatus Obscuribacterales bacterium]
MAFENNEAVPAKATEEDQTASALLDDAMSEPMEERRRHGHYNPFPQRPFERPTSKVSATQIVVRDGKITVTR